MKLNDLSGGSKRQTLVTLVVGAEGSLIEILLEHD